MLFRSDQSFDGRNRTRFNDLSQEAICRSLATSFCGDWLHGVEPGWILSEDEVRCMGESIPFNLAKRRAQGGSIDIQRSRLIAKAAEPHNCGM